MNVFKTAQLPLVEFLRYVNDGNDHHKYILERRKSNYKETNKWVTGTSPRPPNFHVKQNQVTENKRADDAKQKLNLARLNEVNLIGDVETDSSRNDPFKAKPGRQMTESLHRMSPSDFKMSRAESPNTNYRLIKDKNPSSYTANNQIDQSAKSPNGSENEEEPALRISECTTPEIIQPSSSEDSSSDTLSAISEIDEASPHGIKPVQKLAVTFRRGKEPKKLTFKGFYDKYLNKTQLRTIQ